MAKLYKTQEGDRIDLITLDYYGSIEMLPQVLASNVHLAKIPLVLGKDIDIVLPDAPKKVKKAYKKRGVLW